MMEIVTVARVQLLARLGTLCLVLLALNVYGYDPEHGPLHASAFGSLAFALGCHVTVCTVEVVGHVVSLFRGVRVPLPADFTLRFTLIVLDMVISDLVLGICTFGTAVAALSVVDFATKRGLIVQPMLRRVFWHAALSCVAGGFGTVTAFCGLALASMTPPPPPPQLPQQPEPPQQQQQQEEEV